MAAGKNLIDRLVQMPAAEMRRRFRSPGSSEAASLKNPAGLLQRFREEARRYYHADAAAARRIASRALEVAALVDDPQAQGWAWRTMAESLLFSGRMREAAKCYERAAEAWAGADSRHLLGQLRAGQIHVLALLGRFPEAEAAARDARRRLAGTGDIPHLARVSMNLASMYFQQENYRRSLIESEKAAALFERMQVRDQAALGVEMNRAVALTQLERHEEALQLFSRLEEECRAHGFDLLLAQVRMNAAYVHSHRAEYDRALPKLAAATRYFHETGHPAFEASCLLNRAEIYHQLNLHPEACELSEQAVPLFARERMRYDESLAVYQSALSRLALGDIEAALGGIRRGITLSEAEGNRARVALLRVLAAEVHARRGRVQRALDEGRRALAEFRKLGLVRWEGTTAVLLARLGSPAFITTRYLNRLLRRSTPGVFPLARLGLLEALGERAEQERRPQAARRLYHEATAQLERIRVRIPGEESKILFLKDKTHMYDRLLALELERRRPDPAQLLGLMERSRSQQMWDRFRRPALDGSASGPDSGGPERTEFERQRRRLSWLQARLAAAEVGSPRERALAPALQRELAATERRWQSLLRAREEISAGKPAEAAEGASADAAILSPAEDADYALTALSRALPEGWGFLSYHVADRLALLVAVTGAGVVWRSLEPDLASRAKALTERLEFQWGAASLAGAHGGVSAIDRLRNGADAILRELYSLLWNPVMKLSLPAGLNWIISPHGPIHRVPLHALLGPEGYLTESSELSIAPSARLWRLLSPPQQTRLRRAWIAGVPFHELPRVTEEVTRVAGRLSQGAGDRGGTGWRVSTSTTPTRAVFLREAARAGLAHIAAHGALRADNPALSFVQLADGPLYAYDLAEVRLPGSTVVLSACSSGEAVAPAGDEWVGLARSFLQSGASSVVMSLWPIEDASTCEWMDLFYSDWTRTGMAPRAAASAMRALRQVRPHPWHWAAFSVLGGTFARGAGAEVHL